MTPTVTVDLVRFADGKVWHIRRPGADNPAVSLCALEVPDGATVAEEIDAHVVRLFNRPVCARCLTVRLQ